MGAQVAKSGSADWERRHRLPRDPQRRRLWQILSRRPGFLQPPRGPAHLGGTQTPRRFGRARNRPRSPAPGRVPEIRGRLGAHKAESSRPERTAWGAGSRRRPRAGLCCHPNRRAPWRTFEFAKRPESLDEEPRNLESLSGVPAYRVFTLRGERATPAQARRSGPRRTDPGDECEICGFTCRQKASLNWHMKKHDADSFYQFSCNICGKKFEKKDSVVAHKAKSHPEVLIAEALAANAGALITSTDILGTNPESLTQPADGQGLPLLPEPLGNSTSGECLLLEAERMSKSYCSGMERVSLMANGKIFVGSGSSGGTEGLVMNSDILGATTEVLIEDSDSTGP
ncbi:uncharacterized protein LOC133084744 [Eubalaena glacialis]|uniref:uncharacterized protein LOC133084744 n=1 Tax=Eubalaena glacialis TaxID=27606 RepID=UPI002A5B01AD|nr:uncharacterized protein LOC133084744 [Eubalaena glacialis]